MSYILTTDRLEKLQSRIAAINVIANGAGRAGKMFYAAHSQLLNNRSFTILEVLLTGREK